MSEFEQLKQFLAHDPNNKNLLLDCAEAAINEEAFDEASEILAPLAEAGHPKASGFLGLISIQQGDFVNAERTFSVLIAGGIDDAGVRFNLAWSQASLKKFAEALETLTDETAVAIPQAAMLRVQLLHQLGHFEDAAEYARKYVDLHPNHAGLLAAASTIAMDVSDQDWAQELAARAPEHPEAKITLATLKLSNETAEDASALFDEVLAVRPNAARALVGKGLSQLLLNNPLVASENLDKGAESFGTHLGSWIAAGWSYAVNGDFETARQRFEHALSIDDSFSETHGSLGVLDIMQGQIAKGQKSIRTARRLDPDCASAALGQILILQGQGRAEAAKTLFQKAMDTPVDETGKTLSQAMVSMGMG